MSLFDFDAELKLSHNILCGIDEAGRGPLAGSVVAACVILKEDFFLSEIDDSKKLTENKREKLYDIIIENSLYYGIGQASEKEIDEINILNATFLAMKRAVENADIPKGAYLIVDGNKFPKGVEFAGEPIIKGDGKSACIAAASILAKVYRDRQMKEIAKRYPEYFFEKHKGYPTKLHYEMIKEHGILDIHRMSFLKNLSEK